MTLADDLSFGVNGASGLGTISSSTYVATPYYYPHYDPYYFGSSLSVGGVLRLGDGPTAGGSGTLLVYDRSTVQSTAVADTLRPYLVLGAASGTAGTQVLAGSQLHSLGDLGIGLRGSNENLLVDNSSALAEGQIVVAGGTDRPGGIGTVTIRGGGRCARAVSIGWAPPGSSLPPQRELTEPSPSPAKDRA